MKKYNILIVDDQKNVALAVRTMLSSKFNCQRLDITYNGYEAWKRLETADFIYDLIIADWTMPKKGGYELLSDVRNENRTKNIPFIMLTAKSDKDDIISAIQRGVNEYIVKPFNYKTIVMKAAKLLKVKIIVNTQPQQLLF